MNQNKEKKQVTRRGFIKGATAAAAAVTSTHLIPQAAFAAARSQKVVVVADGSSKLVKEKPVQWAVEWLRNRLKEKGVAVEMTNSLDRAPRDAATVIVTGSKSNTAKSILKDAGLSPPGVPEALAIVAGKADGRSVLLASGFDVRGLVYAVLELADRARYSDDPVSELKRPDRIVEEPANCIRSIYRTFTSEIEDKPWFYDRDMWPRYLTMLATQRINRFSLTLGMGYNTPNRIRDSYLFFAYPFLLDVPGYGVRAIGLSDAERDRNLEMLKFISDETAARGMHFQLALWSHGAHWPNSEEVNYPLEGLTDENHAAYCRDALLAVLKACPSISGITFRVHGESGVPHGSDDFWKILFEAHVRCGRSVEIDMHGKKITQFQIQTALATGMPVVVSPKYCGEQMGLGYHQAAIRSNEMMDAVYVERPSGVGLDKGRKYTRYGYGDLMPEDRRWGILHRIWPGTQVLLLSGDPVLAACYGRFASFCGGLGVEQNDPLNFKGRRGSGHPGNRCAYADKSLVPKYDWQKYLYSYRVWGRLTYNPDADPEVWRRYTRHPFKAAAEPIGKALASASRVLKLITTAHGPSANCTLYWPEMYINMPIVDPERNVPYNDTDRPKKFGNVSPFDPQLFSRIDEFADARIEGKRLQKYSPLEVAQWLDGLATTATENLARADARIADKTEPEYRRWAADIKIQSGIARFFASKMRSAVLWRVFERTGDVPPLTKALEAYRTARKDWAKMAEAAKAIYVSDVTFGDNSNTRGHWIDRLPDIDGDIEDMRKKLEEAKTSGTTTGNQAFIRQAIREIQSPPDRPGLSCRHTPIEEFRPGEAMNIEFSIRQSGVREVTLHYRRVNQALNWQARIMTFKGGRYQGTIPAEYAQTRYPMQYYFGIDAGKAGQALYPGLDLNLKHLPYFVVRRIGRNV
ncbi:MAG: twin-arginine translocation signal domain-containing protein [Planctomycetota bacterium]|jgi:hypothetical protein